MVEGGGSCGSVSTGGAAEGWGGGDCGWSGFRSIGFSICEVGAGFVLLSECCRLRDPFCSSVGSSGVRGLLSSAFISTPVSGSVILIARDTLLFSLIGACCCCCCCWTPGGGLWTNAGGWTGWLGTGSNIGALILLPAFIAFVGFVPVGWLVQGFKNDKHGCLV